MSKKTSNKLIYEVVKMHSAFLFVVHEQAPALMTFLNSMPYKVFKAPNGWRVTYDLVPEINVEKKVIYLRGSQTVSNRRVDRTMYLNSNVHRDSLIGEIKSALTAFTKAAKPKRVKTSLIPFPNTGTVIAYLSLGGPPVLSDRDVVVLK